MKFIYVAGNKQSTSAKSRPKNRRDYRRSESKIVVAYARFVSHGEKSYFLTVRNPNVDRSREANEADSGKKSRKRVNGRDAFAKRIEKNRLRAPIENVFFSVTA